MCSIEKVVLKNFCNIHRKTPVLESLFNKGLQLYYKETPTQAFSRENYEIFKNTYFKDHLKRLLLSFLRYLYRKNDYMALNTAFLKSFELLKGT